MSAESPREGLRLLAMLIAADLRAGCAALAETQAEQAEAPRRGRKPTKVVAIAAHHPIARAA